MPDAPRLPALHDRGPSRYGPVAEGDPRYVGTRLLQLWQSPMSLTRTPTKKNQSGGNKKQATDREPGYDSCRYEQRTAQISKQTPARRLL